MKGWKQSVFLIANYYEKKQFKTRKDLSSVDFMEAIGYTLKIQNCVKAYKMHI